MKKIRSFGMLLVTLALIGGCSDQTPPDTGSAPKDTYFWADAGNGKNIIVGISDPASFPDKAAFAPKTGFWYTIWLASESDIASDPLSMGTITVNGEQLFFSPFPNMGFSESVFKGTLSGGKLTMDSIPGTKLADIPLAEGGAFDFDPDDPRGSLPSVPDTGGDDGDWSVSTSGAFKPGRHVTDVAFTEKPTAKSAYEGFPVDLTGMTVEITYNNGDKVTRTSANANEFIVIPPVYETANGVHTIQYIAEYYDQDSLTSASAKREFRAPANDQAKNSYFYAITNSETELIATIAGDKEFFEGDSSFDFSGVSIKAKYSTGEKTITPTAAYKTTFHAAGAPDDSTLTVQIGRKHANIPIKHNKVYSVSEISIATAPNFSDQILFDDPRFFSSDADIYWLSRFSGATLRLSYATTSAKKVISIIRARTEERLSLEYPGNLAEKNPRIRIILFGDDRREIETFQVVPVYNKLLSISIQQLKEGRIILKGNGSLPPDDEQSFLKQIKISAVYQMGSDKTKTVKRDNILIYPTAKSSNPDVVVNSDLINAPDNSIVTNVTTEAGGILNESNSKSYDNKNKLSKARVTFTTESAGTMPQITAKSATIEVGVTGYE